MCNLRKGPDKSRTVTARSLAAPSAISPLLGEAFGSGMGLVGIPVAGEPLDLASHPQADKRVLLSDATFAACRTPAVAVREKHDAGAEIENLLHLEHIVVEAPIQSRA